jgi:hypothetical protein
MKRRGIGHQIVLVILRRRTFGYRAAAVAGAAAAVFLRHCGLAIIDVNERLQQLDGERVELAPDAL